MTIRTIDARQAMRLMEEKGAKLVDIREPMEHARERIPGAELVPLSKMPSQALQQSPAVIFHCQSGNRTTANAGVLAACGCRFGQGFLLGRPLPLEELIRAFPHARTR